MQSDEPSITIIVDETAPVARLFPLQQGKGISLNKVMIQWKLEETNPAERPIALSFSSNPNGPWEPIAGWIANTGSYVWTLNSETPPKSYVRLIVRDIAGNLSSVKTPQPIVVDLAKPTARIVDVEVSTSPSQQN